MAYPYRRPGRSYRRFNRRRRRYTRRPRGWRRTPSYRAFKQIRNLQKQRELKYKTVGVTDQIYSHTDAGSGLFDWHSYALTDIIEQGDQPDQRNGRRIKVTSLSMNIQLTNKFYTSLPGFNPPTYRVIFFIMKEGEVPVDPGLMFNPVGPNGFWRDDWRFSKKTLLDRKYTFSTDRPTTNMTYRLKIPASIITTPDYWNNIHIMIVTAHNNDTIVDPTPMIDVTYNTRINFHDS